MRTRSHFFSRRAAALLSGAMLLIPLVVTSASADPPPWARGGWKNGRGHGYARSVPDTRGYVVVRRTRTVVVQPAFPEAFCVRRPTFVVAQPVPVWATPYRSVSGAIGIHTRGLNLDFAFSKQRPYYGCSFCGNYFNSYDAWARHEQYCPDRPAGRILCQPWDDDELRACQDQAGRAYERDNGGYEDDPGYGDPQDGGHDYRHGDPSYRGGDDR